jgi:CheY-like chemotaxis protein
MAKLMLVEDDNNLREIYEARLQAEGYGIVSAKDGEEALVLAKAEKPDLIISDVMMPKISGFEMLDILRNTEGLKQVKIIMLTALGQNDDQKLAGRLGADRYLVKSQVTLEDIVKVTHELLGDAEATPAAVAPAPATPATTTPPAADPAPTTPVPAPVASTPPPAPPVVAAPPSPSAPEATPPVPATTPAPTTAPLPPPAADPPAAPSDPSSNTDQPAIDATQVAAAADDTAQSTSVEEASIDNRIEDFVAGASEDPTAPADTEAAAEEPAKASTPDAAPAAPEATPPPAPMPEESAPPVEPDDQPAGAPAPKPSETSEQSEPSTPTNPDLEPTDTAEKPTAVATEAGHHNGKVVTPIDTSSKKDLDSLLAVEEAKAASGSTPVTTPVAVTDSTDSQPTTAPPNTVIQPSPEAAEADTVTSSAKPVVTTPTDPGDPNNIAL